jgi:hypothetical protein
MWRLFHKLFGWDYLWVEYGNGVSVARLRRLYNGRKYVKVLNHVHFLDGKYFRQELRPIALTPGAQRAIYEAMEDSGDE